MYFYNFLFLNCNLNYRKCIVKSRLLNHGTNNQINIQNYKMKYKKSNQDIKE